MMSLRSIVSIAVLLMALMPVSAAEERGAQALAEPLAGRVALVVGNSDYAHADPLNNPKNDAADIAALLRHLDFDVIEGIDLTQEMMVERIQEFAQKAEAVETALFYYAGHGIQVDGRNYLIPTDAKLDKKTLLRYQTIELDEILNVMAGKGRVAIVLLDACRNNPLARSYQRALGASRSLAVGEGLAYPEAKAEGLLIGFATSPGDTAADGLGRNSPYAAALLKHLEEPNALIEQVLKRVGRDVGKATNDSQRPWYNSSLSDDFAMNPRRDAPEATGVPVVAGPEEAPETEPLPLPKQSDGLAETIVPFIPLVLDSPFTAKDDLGGKTPPAAE